REHRALDRPAAQRRHQRNALGRRALRDARELEDRRQQVGLLAQLRELAARGLPGQLEQQRYVHELLVQRGPAVAPIELGEALAVVGADDDQRTPVEAARLQLV